MNSNAKSIIAILKTTAATLTVPVQTDLRQWKRATRVAAKLILTCLLHLPALPVGAVTVYDNGDTNQVTTIVDDIEVRNGAGPAPDVTEVTMLAGGKATSLRAFQDSVVNVLAGEITGNLVLSDNSQLVIGGGKVGGTVTVGGRSKATLQSGEAFVFNVNADGTALVTGGTVRDDLRSAGRGVVEVQNVFVDDDVAASGNSVMHLKGGIYDEDVSTSGDAVINISGGEYVRIFSNDASVTADNSTINITGGTFGKAGQNVGGTVTATLAGTVVFQNAAIAGVNTNNAPTARFAAVLNGHVDIAQVQFGDLELSARNGGTLDLERFQADDVTVDVSAGGEVNILSGSAASLIIDSELNGNIHLRGGKFASSSVVLQSESVLTLYGRGFTVNGTPVEQLNSVFGDPNAFNPQTGELRLIAGKIGGQLLDGSSVNLSFQRSFFPVPGARVFLVPEPTGAGWMLCGVLISSRLRRRS